MWKESTVNISCAYVHTAYYKEFVQSSGTVNVKAIYCGSIATVLSVSSFYYSFPVAMQNYNYHYSLCDFVRKLNLKWEDEMTLKKVSLTVDQWELTTSYMHYSLQQFFPQSQGLMVVATACWKSTMENSLWKVWQPYTIIMPAYKVKIIMIQRL